METLLATALLIAAVAIFQKSNHGPREFQIINNYHGKPIPHHLLRQRDTVSGSTKGTPPLSVVQTTLSATKKPTGDRVNNYTDFFASELKNSDYQFQILNRSAHGGEHIEFREENGRAIQVLQPALGGSLFYKEPYKNNNSYNEGAGRSSAVHLVS